MNSPEVRSTVPPQRRFVDPTRCRPGSSNAAQRLLRIAELATAAVHVYANTGRWDGDAQLGAALGALAAELEPLVADRA